MVVRIRAAIDKLLLSGVTAIRSHINCGSNAGITHLIAAHEAVAGYGHLVDIEFVALTHSPMVGPDGELNRKALHDAIEFGADLVGGCPHLELDGAGSIAYDLATARAAGVPVDLHVDETLDPTVLTLRDPGETGGRPRVRRAGSRPATASASGCNPRTYKRPSPPRSPMPASP